MTLLHQFLNTTTAAPQPKSQSSHHLDLGCLELHPAPHLVDMVLLSIVRMQPTGGDVLVPQIVITIVMVMFFTAYSVSVPMMMHANTLCTMGLLVSL